MFSKSSKWLYFLGQLKLAKVSPNDLVLFYTICINILVNNWAVSIIVPGASYNTGLEDLWILPLGEHHDQLCNNLFSRTLSDARPKIRNLSPPTRRRKDYKLKKKKNISEQFWKPIW